MGPRVFVNNVDGFASRNISKVISASVAGASLVSAEEGAPTGDRYFVVGSLSHPSKTAPLWIDEVAKPKQKEDLEATLLSSDVIIYDITTSQDQVDEASWAVSLLYAECHSFKKPKVFVCVSTCLTWAKTKVDPEDDEAPFPEDEYRRRKPHPNYKTHINTEKLVIKCGKDTDGKFSTYVVTAGAMYGAEESTFHSLFKMAWSQSPTQLPIYGTGLNVIPTIHITDLANIIINVVESKPEQRYVLAADDSTSSLDDITRAISTSLGTGKVRNVAKEDALSEADILESDYILLTSNMRLAPTVIKDFVNMTWVAQTGLVENIDAVIKEYKKSRQLNALKICVLGPPSSGKTALAKELCAVYKLHHINLGEVISSKLKALETAAAVLQQEEGLPEDTSEAESAKEQLDAIAQERPDNNGKIGEDRVISWIQAKVNSMPCKNQGYVLDGYPKTEEQAKRIFCNPNGDNTDEIDKALLPEFVFILNAGDMVLRERVMNLPEAVVEGTHNTEEGFARRLQEYKVRAADDVSVPNFFDLQEIHPVDIDATREMWPLVTELRKIVGQPRNYGPTEEERVVIQAKEAVEEAQRKEKERQVEHQQMQAQSKKDAAHQAEWSIKLAEVKRQEEETLEAASAPLRNYLMKHVMPTLTQGLVEVCKARPEDPIDFLAEYLFKLNPKID